MIVIDTHALVWLFQADPRLGAVARSAIRQARDDGGVMIPAIMAWEIGMLVDKNRIVLGMDPTLWFANVLCEPGFTFAAMDVAIGLDAGTLPGGIHGDPADRLMIATARTLQVPVLTGDEKILDYAAVGHVSVIDARV